MTGGADKENLNILPQLNGESLNQAIQAHLRGPEKSDMSTGIFKSNRNEESL